MKVKICGVTKIEDALLAEKLGAHFIGLNFAKNSPRRVTVAQAKKIVQKLRTAKPVGVFVEQTIAEILRIATDIKLYAVQLYQPYTLKCSNLKVIYAIPVKDKTAITLINTVAADYYLLDAYDPYRKGGSGKTFDWRLLQQNLDNVFIAGGINPTNVKQACALQPFAIDLASGVETSAGIKDPKKMQALFQEIASC